MFTLLAWFHYLRTVGGIVGNGQDTIGWPAVEERVVTVDSAPWCFDFRVEPIRPVSARSQKAQYTSRCVNVDKIRSFNLV